MTSLFSFKKHLLLCTIVVLSLCGNAAALADEQKVQRVLFVGNSFSYFNDGISRHYSSFVKASPQWQRGRYRTRLQTLSGGRLHEHASGLEATLAGAKARQQPWQIVVLQGHSNEPIKQFSQFSAGAKQLSSMVRKHGGTPVFFMTWAYENQPAMTAQLQEAYERVAIANQTTAVPVGLAFALARKQHPNLALYTADLGSFDDDGKATMRPVVRHPNLAGSYLAAAVFYATFHQTNPIGSHYQAGLDPAVAEKLQKVAWQTVTHYQ